MIRVIRFDFQLWEFGFRLFGSIQFSVMLRKKLTKKTG